MGIKWEDRYEQLGHLPEHTLYDLARNQSADIKFRQVAAEIMVMKGFAKSNTPEVQALLPTTPAPVIHESEPTLLPSLVKIGGGSSVEHSDLKEYTGPFKASVTTESLHQPEIVPEPVQKISTSMDVKK